MSFPTNFQDDWINIQFAPEVDETAYWDIINNTPRFRQFIKNTSRLKKSEHAGQVKMNLCEKCENKCTENCKLRKKS